MEVEEYPQPQVSRRADERVKDLQVGPSVEARVVLLDQPSDGGRLHVAQHVGHLRGARARARVWMDSTHWGAALPVAGFEPRTHGQRHAERVEAACRDEFEVEAHRLALEALQQPVRLLHAEPRHALEQKALAAVRAATRGRVTAQHNRPCSCGPQVWRRRRRRGWRRRRWHELRTVELEAALAAVDVVSRAVAAVRPPATLAALVGLVVGTAAPLRGRRAAWWRRRLRAAAVQAVCGAVDAVGHGARPLVAPASALERSLVGAWLAVGAGPALDLAAGPAVAPGEARGGHVRFPPSWQCLASEGGRGGEQQCVCVGSVTLWLQPDRACV